MNHEVVVATLLEWFAVEVAVDVVFQLRTTLRIRDIGLGWQTRYEIADRVQSCDWISLDRVWEEREQ